MHKWKTLTILFLLFCDSSNGQTIENIKVLKQKFATADSVVLISHKITEEYAPKSEELAPNVIPKWDIRDTSAKLDRQKDLQQAPPKFLIKGELSRQIIKEIAILNDSDRIKLSNILLRKVLLNQWTPYS